MKRCPKCNRTYSTDTQKFCTHDGGLLFMLENDLDKTVQFDSSKVRDAVSKPTTRDLGEHKGAFDPEATVVTPAAQAPVAEAPPIRARDTGSLGEPQPTQHAITLPPAVTSTGPMAPPPSEPAPTSAPPPVSTPARPPEVSAPLPPPPISAPLPPTQVVSGPIEPPAQAPSASGPIAPLPAAAAAPQPSQPLPPMAAPAKKRSKVPLILGLVAVVLLLFVGAAAVGGFIWWKQRQRTVVVQSPTVTEPTDTAPPTNTPTPAEVATPSSDLPPYNAPADAVQYVNAKDQLSGKLADNFVAFNFYYPDRWVKVPSSENFVTVERRLPPDFTQERFGVAPWYAPPDTTTFNDAFFETLVAKDDSNFAKNYPEYRKVSAGPVKVGSYDGYELRFESISRGTDKGDLTIWGREIFFPPREGEKAGVKFLILTTSLAPELKGMDDVGVKGELPMLLESFRFGK
jgi:hypothetical protein